MRLQSQVGFEGVGPLPETVCVMMGKADSPCRLKTNFCGEIDTSGVDGDYGMFTNGIRSVKAINKAKLDNGSRSSSSG